MSSKTPEEVAVAQLRGAMDAVAALDDVTYQVLVAQDILKKQHDAWMPPPAAQVSRGAKSERHTSARG
jgi:hypothetical protein